MNTAEQLRLFAIKHRWAYEELVFDAKCQEWNRLYSEGTKALFQWLKVEHGGRWGAVKALRRDLRAAGRSVPKIDFTVVEEVKAEYRRILRADVWVLEENVFEHKKQEAILLFDSVKAMYGYLVWVCGSPDEVLSALWAVAQSGRRRKTLWRRKQSV